MQEFEERLKESFSKVKKDLNSTNERITKLEEKIEKQEQKTNELMQKIDEILGIIKKGDNGDQKNVFQVPEDNQAFKQLSDQSSDRAIERSSDQKNEDQNGQLRLNNDKYGSSTGNEGAERLSERLSDQAIIKQSSDQAINRSIDQSSVEITQNFEKNIEELKLKVDSIFFKLTKQELKLFLLVYQLEDEGISATTQALSERIKLSESCVRAYLSSLFNKNVPISKFRVGNRTNVWVIKQDFKALNLKKRLIDLFYSRSPQKTLFNF